MLLSVSGGQFNDFFIPNTQVMGMGWRGGGGGGGEMKWNRRCPPRAWFKLVRMSTYA